MKSTRQSISAIPILRLKNLARVLALVSILAFVVEEISELMIDTSIIEIVENSESDTESQDKEEQTEEVKDDLFLQKQGSHTSQITEVLSYAQMQWVWSEPSGEIATPPPEKQV